MSKDDANSDRSGRFTALLRGVLRRKGAIAVILLPAFTIGGLVAYLSPPRFTATAVIRIDSSSAATPKARLPASERESLAATHAALVVDPDLARVVIDDLELSPESLLKPVSLRHLVERKISRVLSQPVSQGARDPIRAYLSRLEARAVPGTHLVHIAFTSANPALSARIANAHAHAYIELALARRFGAGEGARDFLTARLEEARQDLGVATAVLDDFRAKYDLAAIGVKSQAIIGRLAEDNRQMLEAEAERVRLASQIELVRQGKYDALPAVTGSDAVWLLKERLASLEGRRLRLQADFRPDSEEVAAIEAQLQGLRTELGAELPPDPRRMQRERSSRSSAVGPSPSRAPWPDSPVSNGWSREAGASTRTSAIGAWRWTPRPSSTARPSPSFRTPRRPSSRALHTDQWQSPCRSFWA
jgi:uncharacterized protein involved in exopolysaccharide biosynthesis